MAKTYSLKDVAEATGKELRYVQKSAKEDGLTRPNIKTVLTKEQFSALKKKLK